MVEGRQYSAYTVYKPHQCQRLNHRDQLSTSDTSIVNCYCGCNEKLTSLVHYEKYHTQRMPSIIHRYQYWERESVLLCILQCNSCCMSSWPFAIPPKLYIPLVVKGHELVQHWSRTLSLSLYLILLSINKAKTVHAPHCIILGRELSWSGRDLDLYTL